MSRDETRVMQKSEYVILCEMPVVIPIWAIVVVYRPSALAQISSLFFLRKWAGTAQVVLWKIE